MAIEFGDIKAVYGFHDARTGIEGQNLLDVGHQQPLMVIGRKAVSGAIPNNYELDLRFRLADRARNVRQAPLLVFSVADLSYPLTEPVTTYENRLTTHTHLFGLYKTSRMEKVPVYSSRITGWAPLTFGQTAKRLGIQADTALFGEEILSGGISHISFPFLHKRSHGICHIYFEMYMPKGLFLEMRQQWDHKIFAQYLEYLANSEFAGILPDRSYLRDAFSNPEYMMQLFEKGLWFDCKQDMHSEIVGNSFGDIRASLEAARPFQAFFEGQE